MSRTPFARSSSLGLFRRARSDDELLRRLGLHQRFSLRVQRPMMDQRPDSPANIPIFPRFGNQMVAVNAALVRSVETQTTGGCKIIFDREHEIMVTASFYEVMRALWGTSSPMADVKELAAKPL